MKCLSTLLAAIILGAAITPSVGQIETEKNVKYVPSGVKRNFWTIAQLNGDCSAKPGTVIRVEQQPSNGKVEVVPGEGSDFTFPVGNSRAHCNGKKVTGLNLSYQSSPKFVGEDEFTVMVLWPDGNASRVNYKVNVLGSQSEAPAPTPPTVTAKREVPTIEPPAAVKVELPHRIPKPSALTVANPMALSLALPSNGVLHAKKQSGQLAPFTVVATASDQNYVIKLVNEDTRKKEITLFVRAGSRYEGKAPLGKYRIVGARGLLWFGEKDYFGDETEFFKVVKKDEGEIVTFYVDKAKNIVHGGTLTLKGVVDGNVVTPRIDRTEFENN